MRGIPGRISKHRQSDPDTGKHMAGEVRISANSSFWKLARAMRRGKVPDDRQVILDLAQRRAVERNAAYLNSSPAKRTYRMRQSLEKLRAVAQ